MIETGERIKTDKKTGERYNTKKVFCCIVKGKPHYKLEKTFYCMYPNCNNEIPENWHPKVNCQEHDLGRIGL